MCDVQLLSALDLRPVLRPDVVATRQIPTALVPTAKAPLDVLHLRQIDLTDWTLMINPGGYVGSSANRKSYAPWHDKVVQWYDPTPMPGIPMAP